MKLDAEAARKDWIDAKQENSILGYVNFLVQHPYCEYREEAETLIQNMKGKLLSDMKRYPFKYNRELMYDYISTNALTMEDLVDRDNILTVSAYNQIKKYSTIREEQFMLPIVGSISFYSSYLRNRKITDVDVLSFGLSGSGGKTCLLASIVSQLNKRNDFVLNEKNEYAEQMTYYINKNILPPATDQCYLYHIPTSFLLEDFTKQNITFWEFAGEQIRDLAFSNNFTFPSIDLNNVAYSPNKKILLFCVDPLSQKCKIFNSNFEMFLFGNQCFECISSLLKKTVTLCKNIIGIYIIITKADTLMNHHNSINYNRSLSDWGYNSFMQDIEYICKENNIMMFNDNKPRIIPISIGHFMSGDTFTYDSKSTLFLLDTIKADLLAYKEQHNFINRLNAFFHS